MNIDITSGVLDEIEYVLNRYRNSPILPTDECVQDLSDWLKAARAMMVTPSVNYPKLGDEYSTYAPMTPMANKAFVIGDRVSFERDNDFDSVGHVVEVGDIGCTIIAKQGEYFVPHSKVHRATVGYPMAGESTYMPEIGSGYVAPGGYVPFFTAGAGGSKPEPFPTPSKEAFMPRPRVTYEYDPRTGKSEPVNPVPMKLDPSIMAALVKLAKEARDPKPAEPKPTYLDIVHRLEDARCEFVTRTNNLGKITNIVLTDEEWATVKGHPPGAAVLSFGPSTLFGSPVATCADHKTLDNWAEGWTDIKHAKLTTLGVYPRAEQPKAEYRGFAVGDKVSFRSPMFKGFDGVGYIIARDETNYSCNISTPYDGIFRIPECDISAMKVGGHPCSYPSLGTTSTFGLQNVPKTPPAEALDPEYRRILNGLPKELRSELLYGERPADAAKPKIESETTKQILGFDPGLGDPVMVDGGLAWKSHPGTAINKFVTVVECDSPEIVGDDECDTPVVTGG